MPTINKAIQGLFLRSGGAISSTTGPSVQRKANVQIKPGMNAFPVNLRPTSGGLPLAADVQQKMENAMGTSFSDVRIHVGQEAASIGALAFTWGTNIHFAPGQYNPHTPQGQFLLGHELTHVMQQRAGRVPNPFGSGVAVVQDQGLEAEADRMGRRAASPLPMNQNANRAGSAPVAKPRGAVGVISQKPAANIHYTMRQAMRTGSGWEIRAAASGKGDAVGSVRLTPSENGVYISDLQVAPEHRRHGLAKQLMQAAMGTARSQGYAMAKLEARPSPGGDVSPSALVAMYQKLGFRTTGVSRRGSPLMEHRNVGIQPMPQPNRGISRGLNQWRISSAW